MTLILEFTVLRKRCCLADKLLEKRPPETDDERFVFRVYQVFKHGGKDEFGEASVLTAEAVELSL